MDKAVPLFKPFETIFYLKKIEQGKVLFVSVKFQMNLKI
jgi:hypothetical protein